MTIGITGAGRTGGGIAHRFVAAGHEVVPSVSRDPRALEYLAAEVGSSP